MYLDHVALATRDAQPVIDTLVAELGGTLIQGAHAVGFKPLHVRMGDADAGMMIELLEPYAVEQADFLERFLQSRLRESFGFAGCPIRIMVRRRG